MEGELVEELPIEELPIEEVVIEEKRGWLKPTLDETYIILLKNDPNPSVYVVSEINEGDNVVIMKHKKDDLLLELDDETIVLQSS